MAGVFAKFLIKENTYTGRDFSGPARGIVALDKTIHHSLAGAAVGGIVAAAALSLNA